MYKYTCIIQKGTKLSGLPWHPQLSTDHFGATKFKSTAVTLRTGLMAKEPNHP